MTQKREKEKRSKVFREHILVIPCKKNGRKMIREVTYHLTSIFLGSICTKALRFLENGLVRQVQIQ